MLSLFHILSAKIFSIVDVDFYKDLS